MHLPNRRRRQRSTITCTTNQQSRVQLVDMASRKARQTHITDPRHDIRRNDHRIVRQRRIRGLTANPTLPPIGQKAANRVRSPTNRPFRFIFSKRFSQRESCCSLGSEPANLDLTARLTPHSRQINPVSP